MNFSPCEMKPLPEIAGSADQRRILAVRPVHCVQSLKKRIYVKDSRLCILLTGEEGKHAAESGMDLKAYAEQAGKARTTLTDKVKAWRVLDVTHMRHESPPWYLCGYDEPVPFPALEEEPLRSFQSPAA